PVAAALVHDQRGRDVDDDAGGDELGDGVALEVLDVDGDVGPALHPAGLAALDGHARGGHGLAVALRLEPAEEPKQHAELDAVRARRDEAGEGVEERLAVDEEAGDVAALLAAGATRATRAAGTAGGLPEEGRPVGARLASAVRVELEDED